MIQKTVFMWNYNMDFFYLFPKYHMKIVFGGFNARMGRENFFSNRQLRMRVYMRTVMIVVLEE